MSKAHVNPGSPIGTDLWVNDRHSLLNRTPVARIERPASIGAVQDLVREAKRDGAVLCPAGARHAMGGQQFAARAILVDTAALADVSDFDPERGLVQAEAGIRWPALIDRLWDLQAGAERPWGIIQKQTGADDLSLGGALAANIHGRGLALKPIIDDVESLVLVDVEGRALTCSRDENTELFRLAIGGYGLFGVIAAVTLRLAPRQKLRRVVTMLEVEALMNAFEERIAQGFIYGDFQFSTDPSSEGFLRSGVFSCYEPADPDTLMAEDQRDLSEADWRRLLTLSHADKAQAFEAYRAHYLATSGQIYWSDRHQLSLYLDGYHEELDRKLGASVPGSEMITELYVPRAALTRFMERVRRDFLDHEVDFIYGTIRLVERDEESFLAWAREPWACIVFNLHIDHDDTGLAKAERDFQRLIDRALEQGGSYFLTYHRWARRDQVEAAYPQFAAFLRRKRQFDPEERFQSTWYRHYREMFA